VASPEGLRLAVWMSVVPGTGTPAIVPRNRRFNRGRLNCRYDLGQVLVSAWTQVHTEDQVGRRVRCLWCSEKKRGPSGGGAIQRFHPRM
jgi:hypothetical protein